MPLILTINGGSSSIKFTLFEASDSLRQILKSGIERIGLPKATLQATGFNPADNFSRPVTTSDHTVAVDVLMDWIEERSGHNAFWLYGVISIGAWLFSFFLVPETNGKSLEEIEANWRAGKHPRAL